MTSTTLARTTDPVSSKIAGASAKTLTQKQMLLLEFVTKSMTSEEAAERAGLLHTGYWKRVSDLVREGLITERTQRTPPKDFPVYLVYRSKQTHYAVMRQQRSGKHAVVWQITDAGRVMAREIKARKA